MRFALMNKNIKNYLVIFTIFLFLSGCASAIVGGAATLSLAGVQERSIKDAAIDLEIELLIQDNMFREDTEKMFSAIDVIVIEQRVLLVGNVVNEKIRDKAAAIAWETNKVKEVLNEVTINKNLNLVSSAKDARISLNLSGLLIGDSNISDINFSHSVSGQTIYIIGIAENDSELNNVLNHARTIQGVKKVVSHIILKNDPIRKN
tara:strand:- start:538 stop:1152 length:615 start_codon:yes stop_codon:yes gene_type:complete